MRNDRSTKILLTLIAARLWALTMTQLELPAARAGTSATVRDPLINQERPEQREMASAGLHSPTSTRPLRWRIPWALHRNSVVPGSPDCATIVSVINTGPASNNVDVEFFSSSGNSAGLASRLVLSGDPDVFVSNTNVPLAPFLVDSTAAAGTFDGFALVSADDPRILVTAEFFQAAAPATRIPPMSPVVEPAAHR